MLVEQPYTDSELVRGRYKMRVKFRKAAFLASMASNVVTLPALLFLDLGADKIAKKFVGVTLKLPVLNKEYVLHSIQKTPAGFDEIWVIDFSLLQNPVPIAAVLAAVAVLAGLALVYLTVVEVSTLIQESPVAVGLILVLLLVLGGIVVWFKSSRSP